MITQIVKFDIALNKVEEFKAALLADQAGANNEKGCLELRLFQDKNQPNIIFAYERFENDEALKYHASQPYTGLVFELLETAAQAAPVLQKLTDSLPLPLHERNPKTANDEDDIFIIFFIFKIKQGYREKIISQFQSHVNSTRDEEGNLLFDFYSVEGQEDTFVVYEHWRKESDVWDIHFNQPYAITTGKLMDEAVEGDLKQYMNFVTEF
ncbi:putative quinol monooxygenase [Thalassotalea piscium]